MDGMKHDSPYMKIMNNMIDLFLNKKSGVFQAVFGAGNGGR